MSAHDMGLFCPGSGLSDNFTASTTSATRALPVSRAFRIAVGDSDVFIRFGNASVTADTAAGMRLKAGTVEAFSKVEGVTHIAHITAVGSSEVCLTGGVGS